MASRLWARGTNTAYAYNNTGDLSTVIYNDGVTPGLTNGYDRLGRKTIVTNGATVCTFTYNDAGEVLSESYSGGPLNGVSVTNGYDSYLRRTNVVILANNVELARITNNYDAAGRLSIIAQASTFSSQPVSATYTYLTNSLLVSNLVFKSNTTTRLTTTKTWDNLNRLATNSHSVGLSHIYAYNAANQRVSRVDGDSSDSWLDGQYFQYQYDGLGQVISAKKYLNDGEPMAGQQYGNTFDDIGNRITSLMGGDQFGRNQRQASYSVNDLNQYTSRTVPSAVDIIGWGNNQATLSVNTNTRGVWQAGEYYRAELPVANSSAAVWQSVSVLGVVGTDNDYTQAIPQGSLFVPKTPETFTYDADGNLTSDGRFNYTWDAENRLINITSISGAPTASLVKLDFAYDYMGRRVQKIVSTNNGTLYVPAYTNRFVYDGWNLVAILNPDSTIQASFVWGNDLSGSQQGAGGVGGLISMTIYSSANAGTYLYCNDANGNVTALVRAVDGAIVARYEYGPFGDIIRATGPLAQVNSCLFSTKYYDWETGLHYYGYRYYNASMAKWLNRDPEEEEGGGNLSGIVANNPISTVDVLGLWPSTSYFAGQDFWGVPLVHQNSIHRAIAVPAQLTVSEEDILDTASLLVDNDQSVAGSYRHAMKEPTQPETAAHILAQSFVQRNIRKAQTYLCGCNPSDKAKALMYFGYALHTIQDATSPAHEGFQTWNGTLGSWNKYLAYLHFEMEDWDPIVYSRSSHLDKATVWLWTFFKCRDKAPPIPGDFFKDLGYDQAPVKAGF